MNYVVNSLVHSYNLQAKLSCLLVEVTGIGRRIAITIIGSMVSILNWSESMSRLVVTLSSIFCGEKLVIHYNLRIDWCDRMLRIFIRSLLGWTKRVTVIKNTVARRHDVSFLECLSLDF